MATEYVTLTRYAKPGYRGKTHDSAQVKFRKDWLETYVEKHFNQTLAEFLSNYTWDVVDHIERDYNHRA